MKNELIYCFTGHTKKWPLHHQLVVMLTLTASSELVQIRTPSTCLQEMPRPMMTVDP